MPPLKYETEYTSNHKDPKTVSIDPKVLSVKLESLDELRAKNKDGLTYGLIFQHGHTDELPQVVTIPYRLNSLDRSDFRQLFNKQMSVLKAMQFRITHWRHAEKNFSLEKCLK